MHPVLKKILTLLLPALIGSGITVAITDGFSVVCKPVVEDSK